VVEAAVLNEAQLGSCCRECRPDAQYTQAWRGGCDHANESGEALAPHTQGELRRHVRNCNLTATISRVEAVLRDMGDDFGAALTLHMAVEFSRHMG
jgi:hypothetical protein